MWTKGSARFQIINVGIGGILEELNNNYFAKTSLERMVPPPILWKDVEDINPLPEASNQRADVPAVRLNEQLQE